LTGLLNVENIKFLPPRSELETTPQWLTSRRYAIEKTVPPSEALPPFSRTSFT